MSISADALKPILEEACDKVIEQYGTKIEPGSIYVSKDMVCPLGAYVLANLDLFDNVIAKDVDGQIMYSSEGLILDNEGHFLTFEEAVNKLDLDPDESEVFTRHFDEKIYYEDDDQISPFASLGIYFRNKYT